MALPCLIVPSVVVPPAGKRARGLRSGWSAPPDERPRPEAPGLLGFAWDVGGRDDQASTSTTSDGHQRRPIIPESEAPAGGMKTSGRGLEIRPDMLG
jgi:hypothetical protein